MRPIIALTLILSLTTGAEAGMRRRQPRMVMGDEAAQRVQQLTTLNWQTSLDTALQQARSQDKLVFWVHMLGQINGPT